MCKQNDFWWFYYFQQKKLTMSIIRHYTNQLQRKYNKVQDVKQRDNKERK